MKKYLLYIIFLQLITTCVSHAQIIVAGGGFSMANGVPATTAYFSATAGVGVDPSGNLYIADYDGNMVRKVEMSTGLIYTIAGTGSPGHSGDGGPGASAQISGPRGLFVDNSGNVYIADAGNGRIRKVNGSTGIITTVVGGGSSVLDSIPATSYSLGSDLCVFVDASGNIYVPGYGKVLKVDAITGIINTIAGNGSDAIDSGDGGPALSAGIIGSPKGITMDLSGNLFITSNSGNNIRKVNATTGIITTIVDTGISDIHNCSIDNLGNIFIANRGLGVISRVDAITGVMTNIDTDGNYQLWLDANSGNIYYSNFSNTVKKIEYPLPGGLISSSDSFSVLVNKSCEGPTLAVTTRNYYSGMSIKTYFGDGQSDSTLITSGYSGEGFATIEHTYASSGSYTLLQVLYNGAIPLDTLHLTYQQTLCTNMCVQFYYDTNGDCLKDSSENYSTQPILSEIDSNGIAIDTISSTSGLFYTAYGIAGDIYTIRVLSVPTGMMVTCPSSGTVSDTLGTDRYSDTHYLSLVCSTSSGFDLAVTAAIPVTGIHDQWANVYVSNTSCLPIDASVTVHYSKKYTINDGGFIDASPIPDSYSDSTITWNISALTSNTSSPIDLYYAIWDNPATGLLVINDTVNSYFVVTPTTGDADTSNNVIIIQDTVKGGCDPNEMSVFPSGNIISGTKLQYTINFTNTGNDTAFNIYVMDTLSDNVDINSLRLIASTAIMNISVLKNGIHNVVKFDFPNINLLDSLDHPAKCSDVVIFTINTKNGLPDGTAILNHAGVFFDNNPVVMTDTVEDIIGIPESIITANISDDVHIYPNPASDELKIQIKNNGNDYKTYTITNTMGDVLICHPLNKTQPLTTVSIPMLPSGVYYITIKGDSGTTIQKFVKM